MLSVHDFAPAPTTKRCGACTALPKTICATNTWDEKHHKRTMNHPKQNSQAMASLCEWRCFTKKQTGNGVAVLKERRHNQMNETKLTCNGVALQTRNETQQKCVEKADSNKEFAESPRQVGLGSCGKTRQNACCRPRPRPPTTRDKGKNHNADTRDNKCVMTSMSCVMTVTRLTWREHT